jgi:hypothetical protein
MRGHEHSTAPFSVGLFGVSGGGLCLEVQNGLPLGDWGVRTQLQHCDRLRPEQVRGG